MTSVTYDFSGRVALVTGGASGVGTAVGGLLAAAGAKVGLLDLDRAKVEAAAASISGEVLALHADVRRSADVDAAVAAVVERHGRLDVAGQRRRGRRPFAEDPRRGRRRVGTS